VIGIVSSKLAGIGPSLEELKDKTGSDLGMRIRIGELNPRSAINEILTVLDDQLANNLGAATGIDHPAYALERAKRDYERQRPKKK